MGITWEGRGKATVTADQWKQWCYVAGKGHRWKKHGEIKCRLQGFNGTGYDRNIEMKRIRSG
jgi:hypothetical protein